MSDKPVNHGWDHRTGGTDPVPDIDYTPDMAAVYFGTDFADPGFTVDSDDPGLIVPWKHFATSNPAKFSTTPGGVSGDTNLNLLSVGVHVITLVSYWHAAFSGTAAVLLSAFSSGSSWEADSFGTSPIYPGNAMPNATPPTAPGGYPFGVVALQALTTEVIYLDNLSVPMRLQALPYQDSGSDQLLDFCMIRVAWLGDPGGVPSVY